MNCRRQTDQLEVELLLIALALSAAAPLQVKPNCAGNTLEMNACMERKVEQADQRLKRYVRAALDRHHDEDGKSDSVALGIQASQTAFEAYRQIECDAVYEDHVDGTIRTVMALECRLQLINDRTRTVWENWLQYMDSTPPLLPEPMPI